MDVGSYLSGVDHAVFLDEDVVSDVQGEEGHSFAELFERGSDDTSTLDNTMSAHTDIGEVSPNDAVVHYNGFAIEDDVLTPAEDRLSAHFIPRGRFNVLRFVV